MIGERKIDIPSYTVQIEEEGNIHFSPESKIPEMLEKTKSEEPKAEATAEGATEATAEGATEATAEGATEATAEGATEATAEGATKDKNSSTK
jgi:small subunit ribosomal protein S4